MTGVLRAGGKILRGVVASRGSRLASAGPCETWRTPGSAAGCNKPASPCAEKPGEVVRNHAVGTGLRDWHPEAEGDGPWSMAGSGRASVLRKKVQSRRRGDGARRSGQPGRPVRPQERRPARAGPGSRQELRRGAEEWVDDPLAAMLVDRRRVAKCLEGPSSAGASRVDGKAREDAGKANRPATQRSRRTSTGERSSAAFPSPFQVNSMGVARREP